MLRSTALTTQNKKCDARFACIKSNNQSCYSKHPANPIQAILEGEEEIVLTGKDHIARRFGEYVLFQGPRSFFQTNSRAMALRLYQQFQQELNGLSIPSHCSIYIAGVGGRLHFLREKRCEKIVGV